MVSEVLTRALKAKALYRPTYGLIGQLLGCFSGRGRRRGRRRRRRRRR
jgi:hypothetical protein